MDDVKTIVEDNYTIMIEGLYIYTARVSSFNDPQIILTPQK